MLEHGLTTEDIEAKASAKRVAKGLKVSAAAGKTKAAAGVKAKAAPKYQHPKTGATWTGHGRAPAWIAESKDRSKFLIAGGAEAVVAATTGAASKAKTAVKKEASKSVGAPGSTGQRKGAQPALYLDPKSGATWSGRGRAPAWLAGAKDRSKFLIGGAAVSATEAGAVGKASEPNATGQSGVVAKKAAAEKVVAKKIIVTKSSAAKKAAPANRKAAAKKAAAPSSKRAAVKKAAASKTAVGQVEAAVVPEVSSAEVTA
jgi:DNA-binding protein H-NS